MNAGERRAYVEAESIDAGLDEAQTELAIAAAMSTGDDLCDDDFEQMVASVIEGVFDAERQRRLGQQRIDVSKL